MTADRMAALIAAARADRDVAAAFAGSSSPEEIVRIAAGLGYDISVEDVAAAATELGSRELTDGELDPVAGGGDSYGPTCRLTGCGGW